MSANAWFRHLLRLAEGLSVGWWRKDEAFLDF
jgi:hypothetical protein